MPVTRAPRKAESLSCRVNPATKAFAELAADRQGQTVPEWLRGLIIKALREGEPR